MEIFRKRVFCCFYPRDKDSLDLGDHEGYSEYSAWITDEKSLLDNSSQIDTVPEAPIPPSETIETKEPKEKEIPSPTKTSPKNAQKNTPKNTPKSSAPLDEYLIFQILS